MAADLERLEAAQRYRDRKCKRCGDTYAPTSGSQKICRPCLQRTRDRRGALITQECPGCGGTFTYKRSGHYRTFCSTDCAHQYDRMFCPVCGTRRQHRDREVCGMISRTWYCPKCDGEPAA